MTVLTREKVVRMMRELVEDKSYQLLPLGEDVAEYLRHKRKRLTPTSLRDYESALDKLARHFADLRVEDFEPPIGTERLERFLDYQWGDSAARTYNKNLSIVSDFFDHFVRRGRMHGDPTLLIDKAKVRGVHRTVFQPDETRGLIASCPELRDKIALRLLLQYGIRKGSLKGVRFQHFDHVRKRLTIFAKGGKVRNLPLPDAAFWHDLERHELIIGASPGDFLMPRLEGNQSYMQAFPQDEMSSSSMHRWWYGCLARAGIVPQGTLRGRRMHTARHTAGQRLLDSSGNLKAVQKLLGHASITTTANVYTEWDDEQLATSLESALKEEGDV